MTSDTSAVAICIVEGCGRPRRHRQPYCTMHYQRQRRHGDPLVTKRAPNGGGTINAQGYRVFHSTDETKREHHIIVERALGRPLRKPEEIHHFNGGRADNTNSNLIVCPNRAYHVLLHLRQRALDACGNPNSRQCAYCRRWDDPSNLAINSGTDSHIFHRECRRTYERERYAIRVQREAGPPC